MGQNNSTKSFIYNKISMIDDDDVYTYPDGSRYEGEWKNDKKKAQGVYTSPSGTRYEGEWKNNKLVFGFKNIFFDDGTVVKYDHNNNDSKVARLGKEVLT